MDFIKTRSTTLNNKYGVCYERKLKTITFMWGEHRFYIFF